MTAIPTAMTNSRRGEDARRLVDAADAVAEQLAAGAAEGGSEAAALAFLEQDDRDQEDRVDREQDVEDGRDDSHVRLVRCQFFGLVSNQTMRWKSASSRLAPPTSTPSTSDIAMSPSTLPGFTLPP